MIPRLVAAIRTCDPDATSTDVADVLWLAGYLTPPAQHETPPAKKSASATEPPPADKPSAAAAGGDVSPGHRESPRATEPPEPPHHEPRATFRLPTDQSAGQPQGVAARSPAVPAVPNQLELSRSLRPLGRKVPSRSVRVADEVRTAEFVADTGLWVPALEPQRMRWLDVAVVVDRSASMAVWGQTITELRGILERAGIFRDVRTWYLNGDSRTGPVAMHSEMGRSRPGRPPNGLIDPTGRRLILVVTDCVGQAWGNGAIAPTLERWARSGPVAVLQMLPQRMWDDCAPDFVRVRMRSPAPGAANARWSVRIQDNWEVALLESDPDSVGVPIPVMRLEPRWVNQWATLVAGTAHGWVNGTALLTDRMSTMEPVVPRPRPTGPAVDRVKRFRARASPEAYQLAVFLSGAPLSLPVMRLVHQAMFDEPKPSHLAEVFLSDLLLSHVPATDEIEYDFVPGVRGELIGQLSRSDALRVLSEVSGFVTKRLGSTDDFPALLTPEAPFDARGLSRPFAVVAASVLRSMGGRYAEAARRLEVIDESRQGISREPLNHSTFVVRDPNDTYHGAELPQSAQSLAVPTGQRPDTEPAVTEPDVFRGVPPRNPYFTGRRDELQRLRSLLVSSSNEAALLPHALHGLGGVGKTQLAVEYVYRYASEYQLVYWISAENLNEVRTSLAKLGEIMRLPESDDQAQTVESVLDALRMRHPYQKWLLVLDNAGEPGDLRAFLPVPNGHVLITSRNSSWTEVAATMEVDVLHRAESIELLRHRAGHMSDVDADALAERLGDLPLALEQAAAWQAETNMAVGDYLALFDDQLELLTENPPSNYPATLGATWKLSFNRLTELAPDAAALLKMCAFMGAEPIAVSLLEEGRNAELPSPLLSGTMRDTIRLRRALREINRYALGKLDRRSDRLSVHRLVQAVLRTTMEPHDHELMSRSARRLLASANPGEPDNPRNWTMHEQLSPHIVPSGVIDSLDEQTRKVVLDQIRCRYARGDYEGSRDLGEIVVAKWEATWGLTDLLTLIARRHLANTLRVLGFSKRAYELNEKTLATMRETLGLDHEHTLATQDTFAADLRRRGLFGQARESDEDNLARHLRVFGVDDQATVRVRSNLAVNFRLLGNPRRAMELDNESLAQLREMFGSDHTRTLFSLSNLVRDTMGVGDYEKALRLQEEVLPKHRELLTERHSDVLLAGRNVVIATRKLGHYDKARVLAHEHMEKFQQRLGPNHEHTLAAMTSYGNALRDSGDLTLARQTLEDAFDRYSETFSAEHAFTLACALNLAIVLRLNRDFRAALTLNERTLPGLVRALGADHPAVLCCSANLSNDFAVLHEHQRAREISSEILVKSRASRGENHPYTLACAINAALDLQSTGDHEAGQQAFDTALTELGRQLGKDHPEVVAIRNGARADCDIEVSPT